MERICIAIRRIERICIGRPKVKRINVQVFYPRWDTGTYQKWARNFVRSNYWRVQNIFPDQEDALQECAVIFSRCANMYGYKVNNPKWFMSLYMRSVYNNFCRFSENDTKYRGLVASNYDIECAPLDTESVDSVGNYSENMYSIPEDSNAPLYTAISEASDEVKTLLECLLKSPPELVNRLFDRKPGFGTYLPLPDKVRDREIDARLRYTFGLASPIAKPRRRQPPNLVEKLRDLFDCSA